MKRMIRSCMVAVALLASGSDTAGAQARALDGVYHGMRVNLMNMQRIDEFLTFLPTGRVFSGDPHEGLARSIDWERECHYARCGSYTVSGGSVRISWGGESPSQDTYRLDPQGVLHTVRGSSQTFRRLNLLEGRLDGTYGRTFPDGEVMTSITFSPDGRFREEGLLRYVSWDKWSDENEAAIVRSGQGTYTLRRGTLELRYDGGPTAYLMASVRPAGDPRREIYIGRTGLGRLR